MGANYFLTLSASSRSASAMAILSKQQVRQLSVSLETKQLVLNNTCHLISVNSMLFDVVNLARAVVCTI